MSIIDKAKERGSDALKKAKDKGQLFKDLVVSPGR